VIEDALRSNPEILAMQEQIQVAEEQVPQAGARPDPQVGVMFNGIPGRMMPDTRYDQIRLTASQTFPLFGKLRRKAEVATRRVRIVRAQYEAKRREIIAGVKSAYYELFLAHKTIEITRRNVDLVRTFTRIAEAKYTVGETPQQSVLKAQVSLSMLLNQLFALEQQLGTVRARLNVLLNRAPDAPLGKLEELERTPLNQSLKDLEQVALEHNPDLQAMIHDIEQKESLHDLARRQYYPNLMVGVQYWQNNERKDQMSGTLSINVPLWWRSKQDHGVRQSAAAIRAAEANYEAMRNQLLFQIQDTWVKIQTAERTIHLYRRGILPQAEQMLKAARSGYETDQVDFLTLIDSQTSLYNTTLDYYRALVQLEQHRARLERLVGLDLE
jgi:outer membrane protein TolC